MKIAEKPPDARIIGMLPIIIILVILGWIYIEHQKPKNEPVQVAGPANIAQPRVLIIKRETPIVQTLPAQSTPVNQMTEAEKRAKLQTLRSYFPGLQEIPNWKYFQPEILRLTPYPDVEPLDFNLESTKTVLNNAVSIYRNAQTGSFVVIAAPSPGEMVASITYAGADIFEMHVLNGDIAINTAPPMTCGNVPDNSVNSDTR